MTRLSRFALTLLAVLASALALADPPARVGRLALVEGDVSFRVDRDDAGEPASINWPISSGALLDTGRRGRAEAWIGSTAFRLAADSQLEFSVLDDQQVSVQLLAGSLAVSILDREQSDDVNVRTPEGRISFASPGRYRIDVFPEHTEVTAQAGRASFSDGERGMPVAAGQKAIVSGSGRIRMDQDFAQDGFDLWVAQRENAALATASRRYVSPEMTGYQDLDAYGDWTSLPEYGAVWYPRAVGADWAPYRFGRWAWVAPWGWTWIDQSPWGFAPFHYGRWVHVHGRWGWVPGSYVARPVYAPALVAWIGDPGWSVGFSFGSAPAVGWFPLAPREVYVPAFRATPDYVRRINRSHVRDAGFVDRALRSGPPSHYTYRALPQAVTVVPSRQLREGRPIRPGEIGRHDRRELERAPQARPAPDNAVLPPANVRQFREPRRETPRSGGRQPEERPFQRDEPRVRPAPAIADPLPREAAPSPGGDGGRRGNWLREPAGSTPAPVREAAPRRDNEVLRIEPERRQIPASAPAPAIRATEPDRRRAMTAEPPAERPFVRRGNEERVTPPAPQPEVREMPREHREFQRREMPRQEREVPRSAEPVSRPREVQQITPQLAPQPMRAPVQQAPQAAPVQQAPQAAPVREMPRAEPPRPQEQRGGGRRGGNAEHRQERGDERGAR